MKKRRLLAFFIDYILVLLIFVPISILINISSTEENSNRPFEIFYPLLFLVTGRRLGDRLLKTKVVELTKKLFLKEEKTPV